jgi:hypothetical protein
VSPRSLSSRAWNASSAITVSVVMRRDLPIVLWLGLLLAPASSRAQAPAQAGAPTADTSSHRLPIDATRIQPATFTYRSELVRDSAATPLGDQRFVVTSIDYAGTPAFVLARDGWEGVAAMSDSLVVRRSDLRPLHWTSVHGAARIAAEFTPDSIFGVMSSPLGKQNIVLANRADLLVNIMGVDAVLTSLPLALSWRDSASVLLVDAGGTAIAPVTLAVEGEEHVSIASGEYDCWIVSVESERAAERLWVTKQGQIVVRSEQPLPELAALMTRVLVQSDSVVLAPTSARIPH